jgi:hypothetical protein
MRLHAPERRANIVRHHGAKGLEAAFDQCGVDGVAAAGADTEHADGLLGRIGSADHDGADRYIRTTDTDWTLVRPVGLSNSEKDKKLIVSYANSPMAAIMISRRQVAKFMLDIMADKSLYRKAPVISER